MTSPYAVDVEDHVYEVATGRRLSFVEVGALLEEVERLRQAQTWQPIETAPKDGMIILLTNGSPSSTCIGHWTVNAGVFTDWHSIPGTPKAPSHWMPLPALARRSSGPQQEGWSGCYVDDETGRMHRFHVDDRRVCRLCGELYQPGHKCAPQKSSLVDPKEQP